MDDLSEDVVWLTYGADDGEFVSRMRLPENAFRVALQLDGSKVAGGEDRLYEVWVVEESVSDEPV